jgi:hypothetical protein
MPKGLFDHPKWVLCRFDEVSAGLTPADNPWIDSVLHPSSYDGCKYFILVVLSNE